MSEDNSVAKQPKSCDFCGANAKLKCSQCKSVHYCSKEHQKQAWKKHKLVCFAPGATCARCQQPADPKTKCCVPHPQHLQEGRGMSYGGNECKKSFHCKACSRDYTLGSSNSTSKTSEMDVISGPKWCYEGAHCNKVSAGDERKICHDVINILGGSEDTQEQIDRLDSNTSVRVLKIQSDGYYENEHKVRLDISLPNLESIIFEDVAIEKLRLNVEKTPKVKEVWMQNPSEDEEPDFEILLPELRSFSCYYWGPGNFKWLIDMLQMAKKLETFDSYKLRVGYLGFYSNTLKKVRLHRAELLTRVDLWAPRLTMLDCQAAYDLSEIYFLKDHVLKDELPKNFRFYKELRVNKMNCSLGPQALEALRSHPRVFQDIAQDDDEDFF